MALPEQKVNFIFQPLILHDGPGVYGGGLLECTRIRGHVPAAAAAASSSLFVPSVYASHARDSGIPRSRLAARGILTQRRVGQVERPPTPTETTRHDHQPRLRFLLPLKKRIFGPQGLPSNLPPPSPVDSWCVTN